MGTIGLPDAALESVGKSNFSVIRGRNFSFLSGILRGTIDPRTNTKMLLVLFREI